MSAPRIDDARDLVERFLVALEARDLAAARACWGPVVRIVTVGGRVVERVEDMVAASARRYKTVGKDRRTWHAWCEDDTTHVLSLGTLHGMLLDGTTFDGVRYCDLFAVDADGIRHQQVWNDFGAATPMAAGTRM